MQLYIVDKNDNILFSLNGTLIKDSEHMKIKQKMGMEKFIIQADMTTKETDIKVTEKKERYNKKVEHQKDYV